MPAGANPKVFKPWHGKSLHGIDRSAASPANHFITLIPIRETVVDKNTHDPKALPVPASSKPAANSLQRFLAVSRF
jgi:hypothetical protein